MTRDLLLHRQATPVLLQGFEYWDSKRRGRSMPARADLDPIEMKAFLPHIVLTEVLRDSAPDLPLDFRYRLMGTAVEAHMSRPFAGLRMSELPAQREGSQMWQNFSEVVEMREPRFHRVPYVGPHKEFLSLIDLVLPLSNDDRDVAMLMSLVDFIPRDLICAAGDKQAVTCGNTQF